MTTIVIATIHRWNIANAHRLEKVLPSDYRVKVITTPSELDPDTLRSIAPEVIFFPHWSWKIPPEIYENYECILFHMTDVPFGRGGSPLQNLIQRKIYHTKISALRVRAELDSGEVYLKRDLYLGIGSAEEIFLAMSDIIFFDMIPYILQHRPTPVPQDGVPTVFKRRKPEESNFQTARLTTLRDAYDFIRMLDAEGYPRAFLKIGPLRLELSDASLRTNQLEGRFRIIEDPENLT